jgi:hypothetical protein
MYIDENNLGYVWMPPQTLAQNNIGDCVEGVAFNAQSPQVLQTQPTETTEAIEFVLNYREDKPEFEGYTTTSTLAKMLVDFRNHRTKQDAELP